MAGFSDTMENNLCKLIFNAVAIANVADNAAAAPSTSLWVALHESDPADAGTQGTGETAYTGYARSQVIRTTAGWEVTGGSVVPAASVTFPQATSTSTGTLTYASIGLTSATTAGIIVASGAISPTIAYQQNTTPSLTTGSSFTLD